MPLQAEPTFSAYFYRYGKAFTSRSILYFFLSILLVSLCSYSVILEALNSFTFNPNPTNAIDAHFWQYSPHVRLENISTSPVSTSTTTTTTTTGTTTTRESSSTKIPRLIIQQIRIAHHDNRIDHELLENVETLQNTLTTSVVYLDRKPVSLATICFTKRGQCMIHSPLEYFKNIHPSKESMMDAPIMGTSSHHRPLRRHEDKTNWLETIHQWHHSSSSSQQQSSFYQQDKDASSSSSSSTGLPMHPFSVFGNPILDPFGRFLKADSIILTIVLQPPSSTPYHLDYTHRVWNALWKQSTEQLNMGELLNHMETTDSGFSSSSSLTHDKNDQQKQGEEPHYKSWQTQLSMMHLQTVQYQLQLFPHYLPIEIFVCIFVFITLGLIIANAVGNAHLLRSQFGLGLASVFMAFSCFTTTIGILDYFQLWRPMVTPWYLLILVPMVASIENTFLLTNAMVNAGCDMRTPEKIGRGLESVGVPMTATLIAEWLILAIGDAMRIPIVSDFCLFARLALFIGYLLEMTFFMAVLAMNVKCVELTDLDDRQSSKRLRELEKYNIDADIAPDLCPIQEPIDECTEAKSCAECKQFKTHRTLNALVLCFIILVLFRTSSWTTTTSSATSTVQQEDSITDHPSITFNDELLNYELVSTSTRFWNAVNPFHDSMQLQVNPPYLVLYTPTVEDAFAKVVDMEEYYTSKLKLNQQQQRYTQRFDESNDETMHHQQYAFPRPPSRFRQFIFEMIKRTCSLLMSINVPSILLCVVLVGIIVWLTPSWREGWLRPLLKWLLVQTMSYSGFFVYRLLVHVPGSMGQRITQELGDYDENGIHRGAILAQQQFNKQQLEHNIQQVDIKTLSGKHVADVQRLAVNAKHGSLVSCGQDGRIILWHAQDGEWMARLDRMRQAHHGGGLVKGDLNPRYLNRRRLAHLNSNQNNYINNNNTNNRKQRALIHSTPSHFTWSMKQMVSARCIKIDQGNKWIASGFDDGMIRVWDMETSYLLRELRVETEIPILLEEQHQSQHEYFLHLNKTEPLNGLRYRRHHLSSEPLSSSSSSLPQQQQQPTSTTSSTAATTTTTKPHRHQITDRVIAIQFVGAVVEYCHPIVAEAAAKQATTDDHHSSQNYLVSVHKSGIIREWDILSGECIQSIPSQHNRDITILHVVECKAPHPKLGVTWVFTASKDGVVKCWERRRVDNTKESNTSETTVWTCAYTLNAHQGHAITALATELPVGGMGALVTGSSDGAVKVWNFETGEPVCTLAAGGFIKQRNKQAPMVGGPLLKFSRIPKNNNYSYSNNYDGNIRYDGFNTQTRTSSNNTSSHGFYESSHASISESDHRGPITQVVVNRYCEVENGPGLCRGCDTCFGNGFLVASSSSDETVHVWRLERADGRHEGSCTLCTKDYHQKRYPTRSRNDDNSNTNNSTNGNNINSNISHNSNDRSKRPRRLSSPRRRVYRPSHHHQTTSTTTSIAEAMELLDIEQLGGESNIALEPTFLGTIHQHAGRGLVFCNNMVLGGVRKNKQGDWEAWFASLKYYDPSEQQQHSHDDDDDDDDSEKPPVMIPVETFYLEKSKSQDAHDSQSIPQHSNSPLLESLWNMVFGNLSSSTAKQPTTEKYNRRNMHVKKNDSHDDDDDDDECDEDEYDEASEMLPFSTVRHVIPLSGSGLACDFGNFIKVVYVDDRCRKLDFTGTTTSSTGKTIKTTSTVSNLVVNTTSSKNSILGGQQKKSGSSSSCCGGNKKNSQCCGGKNSVNGKCCGGKGHVNRRRTTPMVTSSPATTTTLGCNISDCSSQANCSRASECHLATPRSFGH
ncbi:hypothetical protein BDA99DRAFT_496435 [Phascolomyces articulosus]|uniref:Sterol regulatory element-binding protein cleavage-activating protein n=1 Tax=Phascolomyces articulosus TaxID=60185 RepID=A0AAD5KA87_9FUNG|nr:hypothetical protein BDA99DRAFT_496435 [Phascolomyces articulosus]